MRRVRRAFSAATAAALVLCGPTAAQGQPGSPGSPVIALDRSQLVVGQRVVVTLTGWKARNVTLAVCGNLARRGSGDCNMVASQAVRLTHSPAPTITELVIFAPPVTCPCVVRGSSAMQEEVFHAPVDIAGVAMGAVVGPSSEPPIEVSAKVDPAGSGVLEAVRSTLGGASAYRVTVTVRNLSAETIPAIALTGAAGRDRSSTSVSFDFPSPGPLAPGKTWNHQLDVTVPAPVLGPVLWRVLVSGAGQPATAEAVSSRMPIGLLILAAVFLTDIVAIVWRFIARRRRPTRTPSTGQTEAGSQDWPPLVLVPPVPESAVAAADRRSGVRVVTPSQR